MQLKVEICGVNTATLAVLTAEEMDTLLRRVKEGDKAAREKLISGNLRLVLSTIQRVGGRGEPVDDLFQVGCVGLIKAIDNFNVDLGVRFSTYAVPIAFRSRKGKEFIMTRKDALREAIHIVSNARIGKQRKADIIAGLELCQQELPFSHWSEAAIFDACDTWVQEHGELHMRAFVSPQMPSHPTIKNRFGMTAREFRDKYYPMKDVSTRSLYYKHSVHEWNGLFVKEFNRIRCTGQDDYNCRRDHDLPTWNTMAAMNKCKTWNQLLSKLSLATYQKSRPEVKVRITFPDE